MQDLTLLILKKFVKKWGRMIVAAVASYYTFGLATGWVAAAELTVGAAWGGAMAGFVGGAINTGSLKGAINGALTGAAFGAIGGSFREFGITNTATQIGIHALAGVIISDLQGGKFGHGFVTAGIMKGVGKIQTSASIGRTLIQAIAGGTVSKLTGGKFANGAVTSALQFVVNEISSDVFAAANEKFEKTQFEKMTSGKIQGGIDTSNVNVATDGENITMGASKEIAGLKVGIQCSTSGECGGEVAIVKGVSLVSDKFAAIEGKIAVNSSANVTMSAEAKLLGKSVQVEGAVHLKAVTSNVAALNQIVERSYLDRIMFNINRKLHGY